MIWISSLRVSEVWKDMLLFHCFGNLNVSNERISKLLIWHYIISLFIYFDYQKFDLTYFTKWYSLLNSYCISIIWVFFELSSDITLLVLSISHGGYEIWSDLRNFLKKLSWIKSTEFFQYVWFINRIIWFASIIIRYHIIGLGLTVIFVALSLKNHILLFLVENLNLFIHCLYLIFGIISHLTNGIFACLSPVTALICVRITSTLPFILGHFIMHKSVKVRN